MIFHLTSRAPGGVAAGRTAGGVAAGLLLTALACEPDPLPPDAELLATRWADAHIAWHERCELPESLDDEFGLRAEPSLTRASLADRRARLAASFIAELGDPDRALSRDALERCVRAHLVDACVDSFFYGLFIFESGCTEVFVGVRERGEACGGDNECANDMFCAREGPVAGPEERADGTCTLLPGVGDLCTLRGCRDGLRCATD